ncbi:hypothetical protein [Paenibacillus sp. MMO-58]|uniref:hypothetical protein n=1 Tax=Paenibacillus sp. MMO-58 TaxID=3081290 RepID=UPI003017D3C7
MRLKMNLLENAYDFINSSLLFYRLTEIDYRNWKMTFINLVQAIELLVKEKIRQTNKYLIYENIDKPKNTISLSLAIERLLNIMELDLNKDDILTLRKAIEIRNQMMHFEVDLSLHELKAKYSVLFEFITSFHFRFLDCELHSCIDEEYWFEEASLMEFFQTDFIVYFSQEVHKKFPRNYIESRDITDYEFADGSVYPRIRFGEEINNGRKVEINRKRCSECLGEKGDYHVPGCDVEQCPRCLEQAIACDCVSEYDNEDLIEKKAID